MQSFRAPLAKRCQPVRLEGLAGQSVAMGDALRGRFADALHQAFVVAAAVSVLGLAATLFLPPVPFTDSDAVPLESEI